MYAEL
jgi:hypothetical protein